MDADLRIFVNIASYRDTECQWTVRDLFEKADHPDRVFVGICWQFVPERDQECFKVETRPKQVRKIDFHAKDSRGVCWARHQVQKLWRGEGFTLQIDSHMRFVPGWDRILLEMYRACRNERAVLSTYPVSYEPPNKLSPPGIVTILPERFDDQGMLKFGSSSRAPNRAPPRPTPTAFIAAGFLFGPAKIIEQVPYDPHIYFQGEEITLAMRLWTHGWDLFTPNRHVIYHDYTNRPEKARHWADDVDWSVLNRKSIRRVRHLLAMDPTEDADVLVEIDRYGPGTARSLGAFEKFSGVEFKAQKIGGVPSPVKPVPVKHASAELPPARSPATKSDRARIFTDIWSNSIWGNAESVSGDGASLARTEVIRGKLPAVFTELGISILGDAGCGDMNWQPALSRDMRLYLGFDIVGGLIDALRASHAERRSHFFSQADIVTDILPACDAILCRDCLTHLTWAEARRALECLKDSGSTYLIATTHDGLENKRINCGGWYPINLMAPPFALPRPRMLIEEGLAGSSKALGVWRFADLTL